jgi:hypothetical protein
VALRHEGRHVVSPAQPFDVAGVAPVLDSGQRDGGWMTIVGLTKLHEAGSASAGAQRSGGGYKLAHAFVP